MHELSSSATNLPPGIQAGDVIANRYRLEEVIGRGGMGVVVAARHLELDERVAVKFMSPEALSDPEAVARFDREVRAAARVKSEYVARVYDAGKLPDGRRYMVSEYLEGEDLSTRVLREGPLSPDQAIRFLLQASSAVLEAHRLGIVHRDLKPANLRVVRRADGTEVIKVLDFGVVKRMPDTPNATTAHETQPGTIVGTPLYTSPEQLRGLANVDARTDIWSLGATLFELLTAKPPFGGSTYPQVIAHVLEAPPRSLRTLQPQVPEDVERIVLRCLEKQPEARYPGILELALALAATVELDAEQRGLLERMQRQIREPIASTPVGLDAARRSEPRQERPLAIPGSPVGMVANTKRYQLSATSRRRLLIPMSAAALSAAVVIAIGLPMLPRSEPRAGRSVNTSPIRPEMAAPTVDELAVTQAVSLSSASVAETARPANYNRFATSPQKGPLRRVPNPSASQYPLATTRPSELPPEQSPPSTDPSARRKNRLLVGPR